MTDRPIIFSAPMVRALLDGRKTQTRRVLKKPAALDCLEVFDREFLTVPGNVDLIGYAPGDRLWVREAHTFEHGRLDGAATVTAVYRADGDACFPPGIWRPSIHMPRWASRLTLDVTGVKVERLRDISFEDVMAEGCPAIDLQDIPGETHMMVPVDPPGRYVSPTLWFHRLWDSLHGEGAWDANPWVVAITFTVRQGNIDA